MRNYSNIIYAFAVGAAAGLIAGLLFAPYKGATIRQRLMNSSMHLADDIVEKAEEGMSAINELKEKYMNTLSHKGKGHHFHN
ncbi:MAG: YtxH domain-containing protein [Bacteroidetes bacterium]|nr:YtxH domain-containing protein [Bacteroidota bacterium]